MVKETAKHLTEYVSDLVGDGLRTVVIVTEDDHNIHYLSDELQREYTNETYKAVVDTFRLDDPFLSDELAGTPVGERRALIDYHENACVIQLPFSESETVLISVSRDAGRDLIEFIESCRKIVRERS
jgi:hypothetical protein